MTSSTSDPPPDAITEHRIQILMRVMSTSGTLAGLCLTGLGLFHSFAKSAPLSRAADIILAADSLLFIAATVACFIALRFRHEPWIPSLAALVELMFLAGLLGMLPFGAMILYSVL
ncbi:MAG TPA: hypothetical protein VMN79_09345 [Casimicrobiaceae bacterium]|nr:hypothetical protein [Casimicrobiaceae bacterium]